MAFIPGVSDNLLLIAHDSNIILRLRNEGDRDQRGFLLFYCTTTYSPILQTLITTVNFRNVYELFPNKLSMEYNKMGTI